MTTINIGTNKKNIQNIKFNKPFDKITYSDVRDVVKDYFDDMKGVMINGWADVTEEV
jgi:hypothetical protein